MAVVVDLDRVLAKQSVVRAALCSEALLDSNSIKAVRYANLLNSRSQRDADVPRSKVAGVGGIPCVYASLVLDGTAVIERLASRVQCRIADLGGFKAYDRRSILRNARVFC
jgi:hypothetical protein